MRFDIITLFPDMFQALNAGITSRAQKEQLIQLHYWNPRDFATDKHKSVDDRPYGGGPGMVMMAEPLQAAIHAAKKAARSAPVIYLSPQGRPFNQQAASEFATRKSLILLAGRYEGVDERLINQEVDEEWSIGDYILTGGELGAMVMIDAITRLLPGTLGDAESAAKDSLTTGLLKHPQYTRPDVFNGQVVPEILLSGHHEKIERWRLKASLGRTWLRRKDLLDQRKLSEQEQILLDEFIREFEEK